MADDDITAVPSIRSNAKTFDKPESTLRRWEKDPRVRERMDALRTKPRIGQDGKIYPPSRTAAERGALFLSVHDYRHKGLSIREIVLWMSGRHGQRVSIGTVSKYLRMTAVGDGITRPRVECDVCSRAPDGAPEQEQ